MGEISKKLIQRNLLTIKRTFIKIMSYVTPTIKGYLEEDSHCLLEQKKLMGLEEVEIEIK